MYGYEWTEENGIFRLTINAKIQKEIRPVFHEELDFFGMDQYWDYPKDTTAPLLWAEGVRRYVLNGVCVAEAQGGGFYTKPTIKRLTEERLKLVPIDTDRLYEVNRQIMLSLEQKAVQFIQTQYEHYLPLGFSFVCAFSGGKDSLVLLDLMTKALAPKDYYVVFSNTGMELSDTLKTFVDAQKHWPGVRFKEAKCHMDMEESWNEFGPPASKLRWCCSVRKSVPTLMLLSELTGKDTKAVVFDGVRAEESLRRSKYTEVGEGVKNIQQVNCHAILKWSSAEIFVYDKTGEMIDKLCPIHPMTIRLLSRVAESFAAAQRTMFRFMKDQSNSDIGFVGYINHYGPDDEARWLTPEWLWDYFFTRESDFSDKDTKVAPYIQHYEESLHLVESDEDALRLFKIVMLLLAVSSTTKGAYGVRHMQGGIAATLDCLENCVAGVLSKDKVRDLLATLEESKLVLQDQAANGTIRLQLPFKGGSGDAFRVKFENNDRKYSRYQMFAKDGRFSNELEKKVWDENDATFKRMKIAVCCAETNSINNRLAEVKAELVKSPYKLGLLIVTVKDDPQYSAIQNTLAHAAADANEPRLTIALLKTPLSDENRKAWLTQLTKMELANESGQTASANGYKLESEKVVNTWTAQATGGGKLVAWNGTNMFNNLYGTANLRHTIITQVLNNVFPYAPEQIVKMVTAYKPCNDAAPAAGIARKGATTQMQSVLNSISPEILQFTEIDGIANATGDKTVTAVSALAKVIRDKMDSGQRVILSDLWRELQEPPFGYYNTIACGILLGLIFSCYKNTAFSWTDSVQSTHILNEQTLKSMILSMCKGSLNSDYLSAGSITFQHFRDYVKDIINLTDAQVATEAECCRNMRAAITQSGAPFWALKYLPDGTYGPNTDKANTIINEMQQFISADIDREAIMNDVLLNFQSRGKVKVAMRKAFQDKAVMSTAFRNFLYSSSPALADVATTLSIQPVDLSDRLHLSMQGEIYTWTEQQVADKLADIVNEYQYLVEVDHALGQNYRNLEDARKDLANRFKYQRIPFTAVENIQKPWYPALKALRTLSLGKVAHLTADERNADAAALHSYGKSANDFLTDSKPTLADILDNRDVNCTAEELDAIYSGLKSTPFDATLTQFNHLLDQQVARIGQARNRSKLKALWESVTGKESVKAWCDSFSTPIFWVIPKELRKPIHTVIDLQSGITTPRDTEVIAAIDALQNEKARVLTDAQKVYAALYETVGSEYVTYFKVHRPELLAKLKLSHGNDMSTWEAPELSRLQSMMKSAIQQQARQEKLQNTKSEIAEMPVSRLRENIASFLDSHPEYCDEFLK